VFEANGTFWSTRGLLGTWSAQGLRWTAGAIYNDFEVLEFSGIDVRTLLVGQGESITGEYTVRYVGLKDDCSTMRVEAGGDSYAGEGGRARR